MNFIERITGLITNPDKTMEDVAKEPRIEEALVLVAILAVIGAISGYLYYVHTPTTYDFQDQQVGDMSGIMSTISLVSNIIGGIIGTFLVWVIVTVVLYLIAMIFGGEGKFTAVLTALGYSTLPKIIAGIILLVLLAISPTVNVTVSSTGQITGLSELTNSLPMLIGSVVSVLAVLWSSYMGIFGIKHTEKLSFKSAALVVGIPLALYILLVVVTRVISSSMFGM